MNYNILGRNNSVNGMMKEKAIPASLFKIDLYIFYFYNYIR